MVYTGHGRRHRGPVDDNIGNRKSPQEMDRNLPEDIGNRRGPEDAEHDAPDDIGNRVGGPAPWSRQFLRGKGGGPKGRGGRVRSAAAYKDMEQLYAAQGEGVPRHLRPGFRATPTGELAAREEDGSLRGLGVQAHTGERLFPVGGGDADTHDGPGFNAGGGGGGGGMDEGGMEGGGRRRRRRRRGRGGGMLGPDGQPMPQGQHGGGGPGGGQQGQPQHHQGGGHFDEDDEGFRYTLKSDPEVKRKSALEAVEQVVQHAQRKASVKATVHQETHGPRVVVEIKEQHGDGPLFGRGSPALSALTFLVNKIVNRYPDDRIRLSIVEEGTWVPQAAAPAGSAAPAPAATAAPANAAPAATPSAAPAAAQARPAPPPPPAAPPPSDEGDDEAEDEDEEDGEEGEDADAEDGEGAAAGEAAAPRRKTAVKPTTRRSAARKNSSTTTRKKAAPKRSPR